MYYISIFATSVWRLHTLLFYLSLQMCFSYISIVYNSPFQSYLVQFSLIWSTLILFGPISSILSTSVLSGLFILHWSYSVHYVLFSQYWSYSVHIGPILSIMSTSALFGHFCLLWFCLVHWVLFEATSVL